MANVFVSMFSKVQPYQCTIGTPKLHLYWCWNSCPACLQPHGFWVASSMKLQVRDIHKAKALPSEVKSGAGFWLPLTNEVGSSLLCSHSSLMTMSQKQPPLPAHPIQSFSSPLPSRYQGLPAGLWALVPVSPEEILHDCNWTIVLPGRTEPCC